MGHYEKLEVWQRAVGLATKVYALTKESKLSREFGLKDQMTRSAVSIASNIAEGDELQSNKQAVRFFYYAKASAAELYTQAIIARNAELVTKEQIDHVLQETTVISRMLAVIIKHRSKT